MHGGWIFPWLLAGILADLITMFSLNRDEKNPEMTGRIFFMKNSPSNNRGQKNSGAIVRPVKKFSGPGRSCRLCRPGPEPGRAG